MERFNAKCMFDAKADVLLAAQRATRDPVLALNLHYIKTDKTLEAQGPRLVAECALRWAHEALNNAKAAGRLPGGFDAHDILMAAAIGMADEVSHVRI